MLIKNKLVLFFVALVISEAFAQTDNVGPGRAIRFDGVNDFIDLGNIYDNLTLPFTISAWVNIGDDVTFPNPIFATQDNDPDNYNGFWFLVSPTQVIFEFGDGMGSNNPAFRRGKIASVSSITNRWIHICGVMKSASNIDIYVNGINVGGNPSGSSSLPMSSNFPADVAKIGYYVSNATEYRFKGLMDDVRLYDRALTPEEVRTNMCRKLTGDESGLIGYWNFDELSGSTIIDKSDNGYDGQLMNSPVRIFSGAPIGDESLVAYQNNWSGNELVMSEGLSELRVSNITGNPEGAHIYVVKEVPSQSDGIPDPIEPYFGVFLAALDLNNACNLKLKNDCGTYLRKDNSIASWSKTLASPLNINERTEIIQGDPITTFDVDLGEDEITCEIKPKTLIPFQDPAGYQFLWQDGSTQSTFKINKHGTYWVTVKNNCSMASDTIRIIKPEYSDIFMPNIFTPNLDALNQTFVVDAQFVEPKLSVFNRWGRKVFESAKYHNDWDGGDLASGVYFYYVTAPCYGALKGSVTIIR